MKRPDWSNPPRGVRNCLPWLVENLGRAWERDEESLWTRSEAACADLVPRLWAHVESLHQELIGMGPAAKEQKPVELRFALANDCYWQCLELIEPWLLAPDESGLQKIEELVERAGSYLEQGDALNYQVSSAQAACPRGVLA